MKQVQHVEVFRVPCSGPGDLSSVQKLVDQGALVAADIVAVMGKTEGNGCVNDFTRDFAATAWCHFLSACLNCKPSEVERRVALVMSGGTEGVLSPHFTVFTRRYMNAHPAHKEKRLVIGVAQTSDFLPEDLGRSAQIHATAQAVIEAMQDAGIADAKDVHFVQVKCPLLTSAKMNSALQRGRPPVTHDTYESMGFSRGGVGVGRGACSQRAATVSRDRCICFVRLVPFLVTGFGVCRYRA